MEPSDPGGLAAYIDKFVNDPENRKKYAEKIMVVREDQETPYHFHWNKMEDIINRGGGNLVIELCGSDDSEALSQDPVVVSVDSIKRTLEPGGKVIFLRQVFMNWLFVTVRLSGEVNSTRIEAYCSPRFER